MLCLMVLRFSELSIYFTNWKEFRRDYDFLVVGVYSIVVMV